MRLLTVDRSHHGSIPEAEPVSLSVEDDTLVLVLDDGEELAFALEDVLEALAERLEITA